MIEYIPVINPDHAEDMDIVGQWLLNIIDKLNEIIEVVNDLEKRM